MENNSNDSTIDLGQDLEQLSNVQDFSIVHTEHEINENRPERIPVTCGNWQEYHSGFLLGVDNLLSRIQSGSFAKKGRLESNSMNDVAITIYKELRNAVTSEHGKNAFMAYRGNIVSRLCRLKPKKANTTKGEILYISRKNREEKMRLGRFLKRHVFTEKILSETSYQESIGNIINFLFPECSFKIDSGNAITRNYESCVGGSSCMAGGEASKVAMYADNPKCFSQLIGRQARSTGRAILFHTDSGHTLLGRIYCGSTYLKDMMVTYAKEREWILSDGLDLYHKGVIIRNTNCYDLTISGIEWHEGGVPYMDDFENASIKKDGTLQLYYESSGDFHLSSTTGFLDKGAMCCCCGDSFCVEDCTYIEDDYFCEECFGDNFSVCYNCDETERIDEIIDTADGGVCRRCVTEYFRLCPDCNIWHYYTHTTEVGDCAVCEICLDGNYRLCDECGEYSKYGGSVKEDGQYLCEDCKETSNVEKK